MQKLTPEQMGRLLFKSSHEPRRNQKRYLKDLGGEGSAEELDEALAIASKSAAAKKEAKRLERERTIKSETIDTGIDGQVAEMLAAIQLRLDDLEMSQTELAERCGWTRSVVNKYLHGVKSPGIDNLARMAEAIDCRWKLESK